MNKYTFLQQQDGIPEHDCHISPQDGCEYCDHFYHHAHLIEDCAYCIDEYADAQADMEYDRYADELVERSLI